MRILLIDDNQLNVTLLQHLIKKIPEYESIAFTDPVAALNWCRDNEPDLVVVDYMMPIMNGIDFTQQFRGFVNYENIPVLMATANSEIFVRHKALNSGVTDFLTKPLDNSEFVARARNMLALRISQKKLIDRSAWLADEVRKATAIIKQQEQETIFCLAKAAEYRGQETGAHILRMAHYSKLIAKMMGLSVQAQDLILKTAPMHDIGKLGISDAILLKPSKLTFEEFSIMKQHAWIGHELLMASSSPLLHSAAEIALTHHEKFDGSGYPKGLSGEDIPLFGRIVAIADVFDALISARPHKSAWSIEDALTFLKNGAGNHFDPICIEAFFKGYKEVLVIKNTFLDDDNSR